MRGKGRESERFKAKKLATFSVFFSTVRLLANCSPLRLYEARWKLVQLGKISEMARNHRAKGRQDTPIFGAKNFFPLSEKRMAREIGKQCSARFSLQLFFHSASLLDETNSAP